MSDIFLGHQSEDKAKAQTIAEALKRKGYSVWWDQVIPIGRTFDEVIEEELDAAKCVVVLWSKASVISKWVKTEAAEGDNRGILIPVLIEEVKPPLAFRMMEAAKLIDWDGKSDHLEFDLLLESITRIMGCPPEVEIENRSPNEKETFTNSIDMKFTLIQKGTFMMGSNESAKEKPVRKVTISKPFFLGVYPVTQHEWKAVIGNDPSEFKGKNLPVEKVSWWDVQEFIQKLNEKEGTNKYRLPSEAEWEYAARAGTRTKYFFGDDETKLGDYAWFDENSGGTTHEVGQKKPNPWGLYDMHGNVWEWMQDEWHNSYDATPVDGSAWESGFVSSRVDRGGGWNGFTRDCRSSDRDHSDPGRRSDALGFRLLCVL